MKTNNEEKLESTGAETPILSMKTAMLYGTRAAGNPHKFLNDPVTNDPDPYLILLEHLPSVVLPYSYYCYKNWIDQNKAYIKHYDKENAKIKPCSSYDSAARAIDSLGIRASEIIKLMEEQQQPIFCIDEATVIQTCLLIHARTVTILTNKYWRELPSGAQLRMNADYHFEELCASLKIPRRTRAIIQRKTALKQMEIEKLNASFTNQDKISENDNESV